MAVSPTYEQTAEDIQHQATAQRYLEEIQQLNQVMARDQQEIELLQLETRGLLVDMQATLRKIEAR